jgi:hypothetical protein
VVLSVFKRLQKVVERLKIMLEAVNATIDRGMKHFLEDTMVYFA